MAGYRAYSIWTPPYDHTSGGIKVMWGLYGWLLAKGHIVYINTRYENKDFVAVYPEIAHGNPLNGEVVVRYLLNKPGVMASNGVPGPKTFKKSDRKYYFSRLFGETDNKHYLFLPIINLSIFNDRKVNRTKTCYFVGKGKDTNMHPKDAIKIDRTLAQDQTKLAELLNECQVMHGYDPVSAMYEVARLCGCPVLYQAGIDRLNALFLKYEPGIMGMSRVGIPKFDSDEFRERYIGLIKKFEQQLDYFIEDTQHD